MQGYIHHDTSPSAVLSNLETYSAQHVPAYFLLLGASSNIFGWTPFAFRMISVWFGLLTLAGVYRLGRDHHSGAAGFYTSLFVAGLTLYSFYYAHIRMYTLFTASVAWFIWCYLRIIHLQRDIRLSEWFALIFSTLLFLSTHIFSILLMTTIGLYHLLFVRKDHRWIEMSGAIIVGGSPLVLWLPVLLKGFQHTSTFSIVTSNALSPPEIVFNMLLVYSNSTVIFLLVWLAVALYWNRHLVNLRLWLGLSLVTAGLIVILGGITPIIPPDRMRYTFVILIPLAVAFGITVAQFRYHIVIAGVMLTLWFGSDLVMLRTFDMSSYLGGRMNIYDMPRLDQHAPLIEAVTDSDTLILNFSNHRDLTLETNHGNSIQDFYFERINRQHYSIFLPQEELKSDSEIQTGLSFALEGWSKLVLITESRHIPSQRIRSLYDDVIAEAFQVCNTISITDALTITHYSLSIMECSE